MPRMTSGVPPCPAGESRRDTIWHSDVGVRTAEPPGCRMIAAPKGKVTPTTGSVSQEPTRKTLRSGARTQRRPRMHRAAARGFEGETQGADRAPSPPDPSVLLVRKGPGGLDVACRCFHRWCLRGLHTARGVRFRPHRLRQAFVGCGSAREGASPHLLLLLRALPVESAYRR